jgi:hypothetical protein
VAYLAFRDAGSLAGDLVVAETDGAVVSNLGQVGNLLGSCSRTHSLYVRANRHAPVERISVPDARRHDVFTPTPGSRTIWAVSDRSGRRLLVYAMHSLHGSLVAGQLAVVDLVSALTSVSSMPARFVPMLAVSFDLSECAFAVATALPLLGAIWITDLEGRSLAAAPIPGTPLRACASFSSRGELAFAAPVIYFWDRGSNALTRTRHHAQYMRWIGDQLWYSSSGAELSYLDGAREPSPVLRVHSGFTDEIRWWPTCSTDGSLILVQYRRELGDDVVCFLAPEQRIAWEIPGRMIQPTLIDRDASATPASST